MKCTNNGRSGKTAFGLMHATLLALSLLTVIPSYAASKELFTVLIAIDQASLKTEAFKSRGQFFVDTKVTNSSRRAQRITVWTQYGWSWLSNNKLLSPGIEAAQNDEKQLTLKPGQGYSASVEMWASHKLPQTVTFRLGFVPNAELSVSANRDEVKTGGGVFWSNAVTLHSRAQSR